MDWVENPGPIKNRVKPKKFCGQMKGYWAVDEARNRGYTPGRPMTAKKLELLIARMQATNAELSMKLGG